MLGGEGNENGEKTAIPFLTFLCRCFARLQREAFSTTLLLLHFFLFLMPHEDRIDSVDLFWLHAEFTCVTCTTKNAVSPRACTIASRSINTKGGSAALENKRRSRDPSRLSINNFQVRSFLTFAVTAAVTLFVHRTLLLFD